MSFIPPDLTALDRIALAWFLVAWLGYGAIAHSIQGKWTLNHRMFDLRRAWMHSMLGRDNRIPDASLLGSTMSSTTFFASTTMIAMAGVLGLLGKFDSIYEVLGELTYTVKTSRALVEFKILLLLIIFAHSFLKLSWALRQLGYCLALVGGAPIKVAPGEREVVANRSARVLTLAIRSSNAGIRGYYFAMAGLAWLMGPMPFIVVTSGMVTMLLWRQFLSPTAQAIRASHTAYARFHQGGAEQPTLRTTAVLT
jgi:uncharacterized membrane protein